MFSLHPVRNPAHHCFNFWPQSLILLACTVFFLTGTQLIGLAQMFSSSCIYLRITSIKFYHLTDAVSCDLGSVLFAGRMFLPSLFHCHNARDFQTLHRLQTRLVEDLYISSWKPYLKLSQTNTAQFLLMTMQGELQVIQWV